MADELTTKYLDSCTIRECDTLEPRFKDKAGPNDFDLWFNVESANPDGTKESFDVYLECSRNYGIGDNATKTRIQVSIETLAAIGYPHGNDLSRLAELVGKPCRITAKRTERNGKVYWNHYFNTAKPRAAKITDVASRVAALIGAQATASAAAPAPAADENPFA